MIATMPDRVTLDVIDRPSLGLVGSIRHLKAVRTAKPPGMRALLALGTGRFVPRPLPAPTPRRIAVLSAWDADAEIDSTWADALGELCEGAREHWHVDVEVVRAAFDEPWKGWTPDLTDARPLDPSEPALILISGDLRARYVPAFLKDAAGAVQHAFDHPGYLGGLGIGTSPLDTTSCSCWRTYADARDYAFKPGAHVSAMRRDLTQERHTTQHFLRLRPLAERGTLAGARPFSTVLETAPA
jgi:hypothetical protein